MLLEFLGLDISPVSTSVIFGAVVGILFGVSAQISRFCLRRGLVEGTDRREALGVWLFALLVALIATQIGSSIGLIDLSAHRFAQSNIPVLAAILGGLIFGFGMVLSRGCVSRLTVLGASGNLRGLLVITIFAIVAHATLKGVLSPLRVAIGNVTFPLEGAALASELPGGAILWTLLISAGLVAIILRSRARFSHLALAGIIGLLVPIGWIGTGVLLLDDFDPIPLETISFTAPWADSLFWTIASTSIPAGFGTGLVGGVLFGALASAVIRGEARLESFETPSQTLRYVLGGALMGVGGVLAGGCTVGAGLSGVSALSIAAGLSLLSIVLGAVIADRLVDRRNSSSIAAHATPAE